MVGELLQFWTPGRIGWWSALDVAVVAFLIYQCLKLIRRTRAVQMVLGAALVVGLYYVSELVPLPTVNWLVSDLIGYVVFAAIVLFQADIRRGLSNLGRAPFLERLSRPTVTDETIEEVVVAATRLASRRVGAIIAIERGVGLRSYMDNGIPIDATVTYDLLVSMFQPKSPLHDGAVIVQENRIAAAACFLPLTVNPRIDTRFGARHRAAIGLTEESDAVALVVSEETGELSLVLDGQVESRIRPDQLRFRLEALMLKSERAAPQRAARRTLIP